MSSRRNLICIRVQNRQYFSIVGDYIFKLFPFTPNSLINFLESSAEYVLVPHFLTHQFPFNQWYFLPNEQNCKNCTASQKILYFLIRDLYSFRWWVLSFWIPFSLDGCTDFQIFKPLSGSKSGRKEWIFYFYFNLSKSKKGAED